MSVVKPPHEAFYPFVKGTILFTLYAIYSHPSHSVPYMYCINVALPLAYFTSAAHAEMGQTTFTLLKDNTLIGARPFEPLSDMLQY